MDHYLDVYLWLFWEERWSDQAASFRVRPTASGSGPYVVVMKYKGRNDILSFHQTREGAWDRMEDLRYRKWMGGGKMHGPLQYDVGKIGR